MRSNLQKTQRELLDAVRLATIGRMASSISHDLRHSLAAVMANAEFLCESNLTPNQREDLYAEIRIAVNQMTDLIESLLEFSHSRVFASFLWRRSFRGGSSCARGKGTSRIPANSISHCCRRIDRGLVRLQKAGARSVEFVVERLRGGTASIRENRHLIAAHGR